jgi:hypothetical protein
MDVSSVGSPSTIHGFNNVIDYGQYQYQPPSGETIVEEVEYDTQGRVIKRTITRTGGQQFPAPWQPLKPMC